MQDKKEEIIHEALVRDYDKYYKVAYSYVHNEADALDIVQEAAYKAILKSESLQNTSYVETWLTRIVINEAYSLLRKRRDVLEQVEDNEIGREDNYESIDLKSAIKNLDESDQTMIILRFYEDKKLEEIAQIMEMNLNTVKTRLYRVLDKLKLVLAD